MDAEHDDGGRPSHPDHPERPGLDAPELPRFGYRGELALGPLIDLRARNYAAGDGRFTTRDPVPPKAGSPPNPYVYASNDPLNSTDPLGTLPFAFSVPGQVARLAAPAAAQSPAAGATASATTMLAAAAGRTRPPMRLSTT